MNQLTRSQLDRMYVSLGYQHAAKRLPESRWWLPVLILASGLIAMIVTKGI